MHGAQCLTTPTIRRLLSSLPASCAIIRFLREKSSGKIASGLSLVHFLRRNVFALEPPELPAPACGWRTANASPVGTGHFVCANGPGQECKRVLRASHYLAAELYLPSAKNLPSGHIIISS